MPLKHLDETALSVAKLPDGRTAVDVKGFRKKWDWRRFSMGIEETTRRYTAYAGIWYWEDKKGDLRRARGLMEQMLNRIAAGPVLKPVTSRAPSTPKPRGTPRPESVFPRRAAARAILTRFLNRISVITKRNPALYELQDELMVVFSGDVGHAWAKVPIQILSDFQNQELWAEIYERVAATELEFDRREKLKLSDCSVGIDGPSPMSYTIDTDGGSADQIREASRPRRVG